MSELTSEKLSQRLCSDKAELAERIAKWLPQDGTVEPQPGVHFHRLSVAGGKAHAVCEPAFCVMAQGCKVISLGEETFRYDPAHYLINTVELPLTGEVVEATADRPYLGLRLMLPPAVVSSVMVESGFVNERSDGNTKALAVSSLDARLLDATIRLVRLVEDPREYRVLAPLVFREIIYRLLTGAQGGRLRHLATFGGDANRMARAVEIIRRDFDKTLRIDDLARELFMSVSGLHAHFKAVTSMSPLQFQKQLRLQEARRLMLNESLDAAEAGYRVGYEDASHFTRDYKRLFGDPPHRDVERLRSLTNGAPMTALPA